MNEKSKYLEVTDEQREKINRVREAFSDLFDLVEQNCIASRETSLAITKLEEAQFWAIKGISRENCK